MASDLDRIRKWIEAWRTEEACCDVYDGDSMAEFVHETLPRALTAMEKLLRPSELFKTPNALLLGEVVDILEPKKTTSVGICPVCQALCEPCLDRAKAFAAGEETP